VYEKDPIRVFVAHGFRESDDYLRVFEFLESVERFFYINVSKPENIPQSGGIDSIKDELISQIKESEAIIVNTSFYVEKPDLANFEMVVAEANNKPIIALKSFGGMLDTPEPLIERAAEHVPWNEREIVDALKRQARHEDTARWETIEFTLD
jgi:G3E family GTPase